MSNSTNGKKAFSMDEFMNVFLNNKALFLLIIAFIVSIIATGGNTLAAFNLTSLMRQIPVYAIMSMGFTVVFTAGKFDMSAGAVLSLCTIIYAKLALTCPLWVAIIVTLLMGALLEFVNGALIQAFKLPAFVLTLATSEAFEGISGMITEGKNISGLSDTAKWLGKQLMFNTVPVAFLVAIAVIIITSVILFKTVFGRQLVATGGNFAAAKVSGIKTNFIYISAYVIIGICAGIGAVLLTGRLGFGSMNAGSDYSLDCIAAVVIGGTSMHGGKPKVTGSLFGMMLIIVINNMLNLLGTSTYLQMIFKGLIIAVAIILDAMSEKIASMQRLKG